MVIVMSVNIVKPMHCKVKTKEPGSTQMSKKNKQTTTSNQR